MSATGCGFPTPLGSEVVTCGTRLLGLGDVMPVLCPACLMPPTTHEVGSGHICEGCREQPATRTTSPFLCDGCEAEYAADMAIEDQPDDAGGICCTSACGYCGACT